MKLRMRVKPYRAPVVLAVMALAVAIGLKFIFASHAANQISTTTTNNAANQIVFWHAKEDYSDADLQTLKDLGVGGIVLDMGHAPFLPNMGGASSWTGNANDPGLLDTTNHSYDLERTLIANNLVGRAASKQIKVYFRVYLSNPNNHSTPLCVWEDSNCWNNIAAPNLKNAAAAIKLLGGTGIVFDGEGYGQKGFNWGYAWYNDPSCPYAVPTPACAATVRALAKQRGNQIMTAMLQGYPGLDLSMYYAGFSESWLNLVQIKVNNLQPINYYDSMIDNFFDGLTSAPGYNRIAILDATLYKNAAPASSWEIANQFNANTLMSYWSRTFSRWDYAASRISIAPFIWIDNDLAGKEGGSAPPGALPCLPTASQGTVACQLSSFRKWAMDGTINNYAYSDIIHGGWDPSFISQCNSFVGIASSCGAAPLTNPYAPYKSVLQSISQTGTADSTPPTLNVTSPSGGTASTTASNFTISGTTSDDQAIRYVSWSNDRGGSGNFPMTWQVNAGSASSTTFPSTFDVMNGSPTTFSWQMNFNAAIPLQSGTNNITVKAVDIHNNTTSQVIAVTAGTATNKPGDINGDGAINIIDLSILASNYGGSGKVLATGDLNGDGQVNIIDLSVLASNWGM